MFRKSWVHQLSSGEVDAYRERNWELCLPFGDLPAGFLHRETADRDDEAGFLSDVDEEIRGDQSVNRMSPADQRFKLLNGSRFESDDRLIKHVKLVPLD